MSTALPIHAGYGRPFTPNEMAAGSPVSFLHDPFEDLVRVLAEALDVRRTFPRVSEICGRLVPHHSMELVVRDEPGRLTLWARSTEDLPDADHTAVTGAEAFCMAQDWRDLPLRGREEQRWIEEATASGYRSLLSVRSRVRGRTIHLAFLSHRPATYTTDLVPTARRIADLLVLAVPHEQPADVTGERVEPHARTAHIDDRARAIAREELASGRQVVGESPAWREILRQASKVAATEATVFLQGESGTGKEVLARFIHRASPRGKGPFVAINCAAVPDHLLESELFGYERGAFTGAQQSKPGQIELASSGVLFLDEISEMNRAGQAKLLRVLQEREFRRLGGTRLVKADVRVIAASNQDLRRAVAEGAFREDLYYRLQVFEIHIPPLRERAQDIRPLADSFLAALGRSMGRELRLAEGSMAKLLRHSWPGNVRELQNALERAAILSGGGPIEPGHLALAPALGPQPAPADSDCDLGTLERTKIQQVLQETDGNKAKAARRLGLSRTQLYVRLRKHRIDGAPQLGFSDVS